MSSYHKVKKYGNRKFYSYAYSKYVKLDDLAKVNPRNLEVVDVQGKDITDEVLLKIKFYTEMKKLKQGSF